MTLNLDKRFIKTQNPEIPLALLLCHPHPQFGGSMDNIVIRKIENLFRNRLATLAFNFRGVGESEGKYSNGIGEKKDVLQMADFLWENLENIEGIVIVGYSFGAAVGCSVINERHFLQGYIAISFPFELFLDHAASSKTKKPKCFIQGTKDEFTSIDSFETFYKIFQDPKEMVLIQGADHFYTGRIKQLQEQIEHFIKTIAWL